MKFKIRHTGKKAECQALFDTGLSITAIQRAFFEEHFDTNRPKLEKPQRVHWINGESIEIDKYAPITIVKTR